jgi:hypothetical protein
LSPACKNPANNWRWKANADVAVRKGQLNCHPEQASFAQ